MMTLSNLLLNTEEILELKIHPLVIFQILDRYVRRPEEQDRVIGTLLGVIENGIAQVTNSIAVPHLDNGDEVAIRHDFHAQMVELNQQVNDQEVIVGWYATNDSGKALLDDFTGSIHDFYSTTCELPVHLLVDTSLRNDDLSIHAFISSPLDVLEPTSVLQFKQIQVSNILPESQIIALSSMAKPVVKEDEQVAKVSGIPNGLEALEAAMEQLYVYIEEALSYVDDVVDGKISQPDLKMGREMADALASIPLISKDQMDQIVNSGVQDLLMTSYLAGLTKAQLCITEKLINS